MQYDYFDPSERDWYDLDCFDKERHTHLYALVYVSNQLNLKEYQESANLLVGARTPVVKKEENQKLLPIIMGMPFDLKKYKKAKQESLEKKCENPASDQMI